MTNRIILGALRQVTIGHTTQGFWRHPLSQAHRYNEVDYWIEVAQILDRGSFDFLFFADVVGALDTYAGSPAVPLRTATEIPMADPVVLLPALAQATNRLSFAVTASTTYEKPYLLARTFASLDHFTHGRIGWNVVTSALESAARNLGYDRQISKDERYDIAEEFLEVSYKLWEGSWADDAVQRDKTAGVFTDPTRVRPIEHRGRYFEVPGIALTEPSPQRTPVIIQAGASSRGRDFAAQHAEGVFLVSDRPEHARTAGDDIRSRAVKAGRPADAVKLLSMVTVVVAPTSEEAHRKLADFRSYFDYEAELAQLSALFGIDLSQVDPDLPLKNAETEAIQGMLDLYTSVDAEREWTTRQIAELNNFGGAGPVFVGDPVEVADALERWLDETGVDGFNIADPIPPVLARDFVDLVVPELRGRGLVDAEDTAPVTFRERLNGEGASRTRGEEHPSARYRW
ncbi:LLM class flavin-dependent oxidoreductase [Leucobacter weissii]|uniref:LLM class flavin-dependent oxidoreductase n=1 Tax=Leucobacter weissii TaxID=1983706 RepID=A0A939MIP0_9MICO|nr:LLM class flavin-dependent oxidoreductase [Leucobacter weissii]MBO1900965.1 LLM class flavin-dependent oxidoreductase [Leucobacter weissii]